MENYEGVFRKEDYQGLFDSESYCHRKLNDIFLCDLPSEFEKNVFRRDIIYGTM